MKINKTTILFFACLFFWNLRPVDAQLSGPMQPFGLMTDLIEHTDRIWASGYLLNSTLLQENKWTDSFQGAEINSRQPVFSWIVNDARNNVVQTAYQILVSDNLQSLEKDSGAMWNSGKVSSDNSVSVKYAGKELLTGHIYFWKVRTWNNALPGPYSAIKAFKTSSNLMEYGCSRYPVEKTDEIPVVLKNLSRDLWFADFGKAAFGRLRITLFADKNDTLLIRLGEAIKNGRVDQNPGGTIRFKIIQLPVVPGMHTYTVAIPPDKRNTGPAAMKVPSYIGEVMPFRYCEIEGLSGNVENLSIIRETAHYPFDEASSSFTSSDKVLNDVWNLCKYSIKATSFTGVYIDGDRERIPYEADAFINQLCHYSIDREYGLARYSFEYLVNHATWPTEWILQSVLLAWNDYLYTGNLDAVKACYNDLKAKTLTALSSENGLISTKTGKQTQELMQEVHYNGKELKDIVDWPQNGILGLGKNEPGETDGFVFTDYNTVVNAYYYRALTIMAKLASALGNKADVIFYEQKAEKTRKAMNELMFDKKRGVYTDGIGTVHASLHSNIFPLAFGIVPENKKKILVDFIHTRGMACSVYGAQFLLDALYNADDAPYGLSLLSSTAERSWAHMLYDVGSTITLEAWDNKYKPNQDWNHAWGAAPANLIPRKLMGVEPLEPGFKKIQIKPQPGPLEEASLSLPTIRGNVMVSFNQKPGECFELNITIPANAVANVFIPWNTQKASVSLDNNPVKIKKSGNFVLLENVGSGKHYIKCSEK